MKKWQLVESRNRFYFDGRCVTGQNVGVFVLALVLITITTGLFFAFDCPYLSRRLSPAIPVFAAILYATVMCLIFRTACSDPGILPRATPDEVLYLERYSQAMNPPNLALPGRTIEIEMHTGHKMQLKFCATCKLFRPPRVSHCSLCNACIANFDHHCPWVGNCVGLRNYRYFYLFLSSLSILCIYIFAFNVTNVILRSQEKPSFLDAIRDTPATVAEALICFFAVWSVLGLWGYHTYLICRSVTTNEDIKDTWNAYHRRDMNKNPFSRGHLFFNCFYALCGPLPPSFLDLRAEVPLDQSPTSTTVISTNLLSNSSQHRVDHHDQQRAATAIIPADSYQQRNPTSNFV